MYPLGFLVVWNHEFMFSNLHVFVLFCFVLVFYTGMVQLSCNWSSTYVLFGPPSMYVCVCVGGGGGIKVWMNIIICTIMKPTIYFLIKRVSSCPKYAFEPKLLRA